LEFPGGRTWQIRDALDVHQAALFGLRCHGHIESYLPPGGDLGRLSNCAADVSAKGLTRSQCGATKVCSAPRLLINGCRLGDF